MKKNIHFLAIDFIFEQRSFMRILIIKIRVGRNVVDVIIMPMYKTYLYTPNKKLLYYLI